MQFATVFADNAENDGQAQAGANTRGLSGEKWVKDAGLKGRRNSRSIVADFEEHASFSDAPGFDADRAAFTLPFDSVARICDEVHQHLLELASVALHKREHRVEIELQVNVFGFGIKALKFESAGDDLVESDATPLRA
jgi:hypothetical protein